ncbi:MAG: AmmeMemoRadiSam system protein A [Deltaproteobacteria bacterium]|jgi:AmmeMemoRadiSam system protein A|nr:AmmeMemoRadiSam system protein A [Deltaproteobacteria bacterium]
MEQDFSFNLSAGEQTCLLDLAKLSIAKNFKGDYSEAELPEPPYERLREPLGAFVTLKKHGQLRGCIGRLVDTAPLYLTVSRMALAAAFNDPRFPPLQESEFGELTFDISIMGPITPCLKPEAISIGRHGLIMKRGQRQGLLLPQVPVEWNWNTTQFLDQTCLKAGLPAGSWRQAWKAEGTELYWFEAVVLGQ